MKSLHPLNCPKPPETNHIWYFQRILTAEWIDGYKISDIDRIKQDKFDVADIDRKLFKIFSEQIFNTGFVHADPHPGNGTDTRILLTALNC